MLTRQTARGSRVTLPPEVGYPGRSVSLAALHNVIHLRTQEILPIILCDTNTAMPRDAYWFERYHVVVRALPARLVPVAVGRVLEHLKHNREEGESFRA